MDVPASFKYINYEIPEELAFNNQMFLRGIAAIRVMQYGLCANRSCCCCS